ncbi:P-loop containing nucleoside triphosphate hydrolase protein [Lentithecium fluviatile CBS 122367]|uniref:P-loop containing nucleoside triphosphate hydrolase protein n=1 Tax=Lentithecium fluviatile CBS 122367 TaxID=1168545 RepID=A0A6G1JJG2_9PLEO|nr:P-loop containing nucleoside triphosphate hydrolase protein [Lentithecium fluviatile CBS 122367]
MAGPMSEIAIPAPPTTPSTELALYNEPLDTPGVIPKHLKRAATAEYPLFEILQRFLLRLQPGNAGGELEKFLAVLALYKAVAPAYRHFKIFITWALTSQVTIPEHDPVAREVSTWMASHVIGKSMMTRGAMIVSTNSMDHGGSLNMFQQMITQDNGAGGSDSSETQCLPPIGKRVFWVGFRPFLFSRTGVSTGRHPGPPMNNVLDDKGEVQNAIVLRTIGWSLQPLKDFVKTCHDFKVHNKTGTTTVYFSSGSGRDPYTGGEWSSVVKAVRKLDTIDMDEDLKADLVHDAEYYYSAESKRFFADCGIPYRRGYMFWGPPGTGKTSFSAALAGHLKCDIYIINLATGDISDGRLHRLFLALPRKCVVVIEDIDSAGIGREQGPGEAPKPPGTENTNGFPIPGIPTGPPFLPAMTMPGGHNAQSNDRRKRNMVTLSGLLNAIDGNASAEGRLLIMTSNNPDILDEALTRPGRIDKKVHFGKLMPAAAQGIFKRLIGRAAIATLGFMEEQIEAFALQFSAKVPADTFTPAQVQNFLHSCRGDPEKALREIDAWVIATRGKKPKKEGSLVPPKQGRELDDDDDMMDSGAYSDGF